jgi:hypothetical protein
VKPVDLDEFVKVTREVKDFRLNLVMLFQDDENGS